MDLEFSTEERKGVGSVLVCNIQDWKELFESMFLVKTRTKEYTWQGKKRQRYAMKALFMELIDEDVQVFADKEFLETGVIPVKKNEIQSFIERTKKVIAYCKIFKQKYKISRMSKSAYKEAIKK